MIIGPRFLPFAFSLLPFLGTGICIPATIQDALRGRITRQDVVSLAIWVLAVAAWYWAILHSIKSKKKRGEETLLGRPLNSWTWSPPVAFAIGLLCGLSLLFG